MSLTFGPCEFVAVPRENDSENYIDKKNIAVLRLKFYHGRVMRLPNLVM